MVIRVRREWWKMLFWFHCALVRCNRCFLLWHHFAIAWKTLLWLQFGSRMFFIKLLLQKIRNKKRKQRRTKVVVEQEKKNQKTEAEREEKEVMMMMMTISRAKLEESRRCWIFHDSGEIWINLSVSSESKVITITCFASQLHRSSRSSCLSLPSYLFYELFDTLVVFLKMFHLQKRLQIFITSGGNGKEVWRDS